MKYSFIKNDDTSFSDLSRVYDVCYMDCPDTVITALVIGYNSALEKYFITMVGENLLERNYDLDYDSIGEATFIEILYEFFELLPLMSKDDVQNGYYFQPDMVELKKENIVLYSSEMMPYYDEDLDEYTGIYSEDDKHTNYLLDNNIIEPAFIEDYEKDEYVSCSSEDVLEKLNFITEGHDIYYEFDFLRLEKFALNKLEEL